MQRKVLALFVFHTELSSLQDICVCICCSIYIMCDLQCMLGSSQWLSWLQGKISGVCETSGLLEKQWCDNICHCQIPERVGWRGIVGGMFVIIVYVCDVMSPTNTENVHCRLNPHLVCGLLEVTHQNTRMQLVQIRGSWDGLLAWKMTPRWNYGRVGWQRTDPDSCWSSSFSQQEILTDMTTDAYHNNSQQAEILPYTQTDKKNGSYCFRIACGAVTK